MIRITLISNDEVITEYYEHTIVALYKEDTMVVPTIVNEINTESRVNIATKIVVSLDPNKEDHEFDFNIVDFEYIAKELDLLLK